PSVTHPYLHSFPTRRSSDLSKAVDEKIVGVFYFKPMFGHVHQSSVRTSASLTTIQCSHPVKVIESSKVSTGPEWAYVQVADYRGDRKSTRLNSSHVKISYAV